MAADGVEVDTQGDAFFFVFPTAPGAVGAAQAMTEALAAGSIQLRIGLHTGTPLVTDEGYVGDDVHLAARVAASGHGGQVVLSRATRAHLRRRRADRSRRASPEGHRGRRSRSSISATRAFSAQDDLEHEPPASGELVRRQGAGTRGRGRLHRGGGAASHPDRPRWLREDAASARGRDDHGSEVQGGCVLGRACGAS